MTRALSCVILLLLGNFALAASGGGLIVHADNDVSNLASLQRGARNFVNYCLGCHSAQYVRYQRIADDLEIPEQDIAKLMFTADKPHETMTIAMPADDSARWFGRTPPDLSLTARSRGTDWIYSYLRSFYVDADATFGVDNLVLPGASMPHVLWELQGLQRAVYEETVDAGGNAHKVVTGFEPITAGALSAHEYDSFVRDLVNFLDYIAEPVQLERRGTGIRVIAYLLVFLLLAVALKKEYWKDVH